jgi:calcineurin-like phosphoesterase family protein
MTNFYTSDTHFYHDKIRLYCSRPFTNVGEMNSQIIKNWNYIVTSKDTVYVLGDVAMVGKSNQDKLGSIINKLNGKKILIMGNHDEMNPAQYIKTGFNQVVFPYLEVKPGWYCYHDPALYNAIDTEVSVHLVGHVHNLFHVLPDKRMINVGMDVWGYHPVEEEQIEQIIEGWNNEN